MEDLYREFGYYHNRLDSTQFEGADGMVCMQNIMQRLRNAPPAEIGGQRVCGVVDYRQSDKTGLPSSDVLQFELEGRAKLIIRPSGTEPKIKVYLSAAADSAQVAQERCEQLAQAAKGMLS